MRKFKTVDVRIIQKHTIPVDCKNRSARVEPEDIILLLQDGSNVRGISVRTAWPVAMSKLCRKRQQAIIDTRPEKITLQGKDQVSEQSLQSWKEAALAYYFTLRKKRLKLSSLKGLKKWERTSLVAEKTA